MEPQNVPMDPPHVLPQVLPPVVPQIIPPAPDPMTQLAEAIMNLMTISNLHLASNLASAKVIMHPTPYARTGGDNACRFLAAFTMWAMAQGSSLNVIDGQGNLMDHHDGKWIHAALSFLVDDATVWATPAMEIFTNGLIPFDNCWEGFRQEFKAHFEMADEAVNAKEKLWLLFQETSSIPEYAARFKQAMVRTGYSAADLQDRFYDHLHPKIKDKLVHSNHPVVTLDNLIAASTEIDMHVRQCRAEKE
jgi:Retrotransposon gag protein